MSLYELFSRCLAVSYANVGDVSYAVEREGEVLKLFFQNSVGEIDWGRNLNFLARTHYRKGKAAYFAHRGFLYAWEMVEPYLAEAIADQNVRKIVIVGYSHGAALAVLCHEYVWNQRPDLRDSLVGYGFGCPRVLWGLCARQRKMRWAHFTVVRNLNDIVTHLPPTFLGYSHVGRLLEIGRRGRYSNTDAHRPENILCELKAYEEKTLNPVEK